ncbi:MAG: putative bifunctional diguanylate cyclase/phosphodiesterase, partial [Rubrivivax sp.]
GLAEPAARPMTPLNAYTERLAARPQGSKRPWHRLHVRIVGLFLGLLLLVQAVSYVVLRQDIDARAAQQVAGDLRTSEVVLRRLLAQNAQQRAETALKSSADAAFRSAVAKADPAGIQASLEAQFAGSGAAVAMVTDLDRNLRASIPPQATSFNSLARATLNLGSEVPDAQLALLEGRPLQLVSVPIRAPQWVGQLVLGFELTADLVKDVASLSPVKLVFLSRLRGQAAWQALPAGEAGTALGARALVVQDNSPTLSMGSENHEGRLLPLAMDEDREMAFLLLRSVDDVKGPYRALQQTLLWIALFGVLAMTAGSLMTARRVTVPLQQLTASAQRLGEGDFSQPVADAGPDEVGDLARSFEAMRQAAKARESHVRQLAYWDALTGLPNRAQFMEAAAGLIEKTSAKGEPCAILMLDLDRFKLINDVMGHEFGDRVLKKMADRLKTNMPRPSDVVARLSGDEFAFCLPGLTAAEATELAHQVLASLERPLTLDDQTIDASGSFGLTVAPDHGHDAGLLLSRAEIAMYAAKERRLGVRIYEPSLDSSSEYSLSLLTELRTAVDNHQLQLYLQPKVRLADGEVIGAEALVRWEHPERGLVQPMQFVPFAEQSGFVRVLTLWMIEQTAKYAASIGAAWPAMKFGVNLSARDLLDQDFPAKVEQLTRRSGVDPKRLTLEITESSIMEDPERSLQTLLKLRALGLRLSIDDFGTGYSSLAYLKRLPLDELKIDRSFVMSMQTDPADAKIVRSTIDLAHNLGLSVVAEGIDSPEAFALLRDLGCDEGQGYRLARPMPAAYFAEWARRWQSPALETQPGAL